MQRTDDDQIQFSAYVIRYKLDLWSTFTYYLQATRSMAIRCCSMMIGGVWLQAFQDLVHVAQRLSDVESSSACRGGIDDIHDVGIFPTYQRQIIGTTQNAGVVEGKRRDLC